jgi:hypothetical protein
MLKQQQSAGPDKKILMQAVAEAGGGWQGPGLLQGNFFQLFSL